MNQLQGVVELYLLKNTEMDEETFCEKFQSDNIVGAKFEVTLSDEITYEFDVMETMKMLWERIIKLDEETKKPLTAISDQVAI